MNYIWSLKTIWTSSNVCFPRLTPHRWCDVSHKYSTVPYCLPGLQIPSWFHSITTISQYYFIKPNNHGNQQCLWLQTNRPRFRQVGCEVWVKQWIAAAFIQHKIRYMFRFKYTKLYEFWLVKSFFKLRFIVAISYVFILAVILLLGCRDLWPRPACTAGCEMCHPLIGGHKRCL